MKAANILTKLDMNREWTGEQLDVCNWQGALFQSCQYEFKCDAFDYIEKFMNSDIAADIDENDSAYYFDETREFIDEMRGKIPLTDLREEKYHEALFWIGYMYRYWAYLGMSSKEIIKIFPVEKAYNSYALHSLGVEHAITFYLERLYEGVGVKNIAYTADGHKI